MALQIIDRLLTPGGIHGRSGATLFPRGIVIHYVGNPGSSAEANRNWFENGAGGMHSSAHYIIGLSGEILRCIPENERAAHAGKSYGAAWDKLAPKNNGMYIGIECCHPTASGYFNDRTRYALVELCADICKRYGFDPAKDIFTHYMVCGKNCPAYYVKNPDEWKRLVNDIKRDVEQKVEEKVDQKVEEKVDQKLTNNETANAGNTPLADKDLPNTLYNTPSEWALRAWDFAILNGLNDGTRPRDYATREEITTYGFRLAKKLVEGALFFPQVEK